MVLLRKVHEKPLLSHLVHVLVTGCVMSTLGNVAIM